MSDPRAWEVEACYSLHPFPGPTASASLTPSTYHLEPRAGNLLDKSVESATGAGDGIVLEPSVDHLSQPATGLPQGAVHAASEFVADLREFLTHSFCDRVSVNREVSPAPSPPTAVGESQEIKGLRFAFSSMLAIVGRVPSKLDQSGLRRVQLEPEFCETFLQFP